MASTKEQVLALVKKEWILLKRTKNFLIQELLSPLVSVYLIYLSTPSADNEMFGGNMTLMGPFAVPMFLSRAMFGLMYSVVFEKSQNFKEYLRVNGASLFSYIFATFIFYLAKAMVAAIIFYAGVVWIGAGSHDLSDRILGFLSLTIYCVALINFSLALTTLFSSAKLATQVGSLLVTMMTFVYYAIITSDKKIFYYLGCLLPPVAAVFGFSIAGLNQKNPGEFTPAEGIVVQLFNCIMYFLLYAYLDRVVPSDSGIKDPIFKWKKRSRTSNRHVIREQELGALDLENMVNDNPLLDSTAQSNFEIPRTGTEDDSSAEFHEAFHNPSKLKRTVFIDKLTKVFGKTIAVDKVTMPIFEKQIFCLLGHNGAGKTTTINLMTGLLRPDSGSVYYDGEDFSENFETVRRKFGLCVQKDILFENLTAAEHIELIASLRGVPRDRIPETITQISEKVGIPNELTKLASTLSGGNKRKLSLALAIVGETKVIFLDEPTSGLDPNARRNFWDIVRSLKDEGKTILLTTHNLDEADELADRIAIFSKGKLLILGTSNFLKKKYGVGYNLIITAKPDSVDNFHENIERLTLKVTSKILGSEVDPKTSHEMIKISLPYGESPKFAELFKALESEPSIEVALELNTLEDVFVNIGLQEEAAEVNQATGTQSYESIPIPSSINEQSSYKFSSQIKAVFRRRFYCTFRNRTNVLQIVLPLLYVIFSCGITSEYDVPEVQVYFFALTSMMGFLINTVSYTAFPVWERENKVKYLLRTIGLRPSAYWIGTLLFDVIITSSYGILLLPIGLLFNVELISDRTILFLLIMLSFGFSLLNLSYLLSWIYDKQATVYRFHLVLVIFCFFYLPFFLFIFFVVIPRSDNNVLGTKTILAIGAVISPPMVFLYSCFSLSPFFLLTQTDDSFFSRMISEPNFYVCLMFAQGLFYFGLTMGVERLSLRLKSKKPRSINNTTFVDIVPNPQEISQEAQRTRSEHNMDPTKALDLEKVYENGFQALRGVTFGVEKRQIFGLLGPNGAGKSTTFNLLTGLIGKTGGHIVFNGHELLSLDPKVFERSGICPQFDALWEHLTVKEHLEIMGQIKGIDRHKVQEALVYYTKILRMEEHVNKKAVQLSGGTKRKLCVANLLVGAPVVQFMDEPSTGLDPMSKRSLYDTVVRNLEDRNASIILTTHSMSEAESLCNKIGILINGKFVCIGNLPYLKSRYGSGYKICVVKLNSSERVYDRVIRETFSSAMKEEDNSEVFDTYRVPQQDFSFEKAFLVMEQLKGEKHISDFNIMNTTLEQVFIQFSRNQMQPLEGTANS